MKRDVLSIFCWKVRGLDGKPFSEFVALTVSPANLTGCLDSVPAMLSKTKIFHGHTVVNVNPMVMATTKATTKRRTTKTAAKKKWSAKVTKHSNALDLERDIFKKKDPKKIAESLKRSAEHSRRKKSGSYQSAMSMLNFYINRAGKNLTGKQKQPLEKAKTELRKLFHKENK